MLYYNVLKLILGSGFGISLATQPPIKSPLPDKEFLPVFSPEVTSEGWLLDVQVIHEVKV